MLTRDSREAKLTALGWCQQILQGTQDAALLLPVSRNASCRLKTGLVLTAAQKKRRGRACFPEANSSPGQDTAVGLSTGYQYLHAVRTNSLSLGKKNQRRRKKKLSVCAQSFFAQLWLQF